MNLMTDAKEVILKLKEIKKEKDLSVDDIVEMVEANGEFVSKSTVARVFAEGSEDKANTFRYENSLRPIANALLDIDKMEEEDDLTTQGFKTILKYKADMIEKAEKRIAELEEELKSVKQQEKDKYKQKIEKEIRQFRDSLAFATEQIKLKDELIKELQSTNRENANTIKGIVETNNSLVTKMMACPLKNYEEGEL